MTKLGTLNKLNEDEDVLDHAWQLGLRSLLEAKRHLLHTSMTVKEIAYDLGFHDPAYFSRFFARRAGIAPGAYRKAGMS